MPGARWTWQHRLCPKAYEVLKGFGQAGSPGPYDQAENEAGEGVRSRRYWSWWRRETRAMSSRPRRRPNDMMVLRHFFVH